MMNHAKRSVDFVAPATLLILAIVISGCKGSSQAVPEGSNYGVVDFQSNQRDGHKLRIVPACGGSRHAKGQCDALIRMGGQIAADAGSGPGGGFTPAQLQAAYHLPTTKGAGQVVAIVDAYDNPKVTSDLDNYRSIFGLGKPKFAKYNQYVGIAMINGFVLGIAVAPSSVGAN